MAEPTTGETEPEGEEEEDDEEEEEESICCSEEEYERERDERGVEAEREPVAVRGRSG